MRSVLTIAVATALVGTCFVATGCASSRRVARASASPATTMRLARRTPIRSTARRAAVVSQPVVQDPYASSNWVEVPATTPAVHHATHAPAADPVDGMVYVPELGKSILDPCGIAGSEDQWIDVTARPSGSATDRVWMPQAYDLPPTTNAGAPCTPCCPPSSGCFPDPCANGACDVPAACPNGQCGLPE